MLLRKQYSKPTQEILNIALRNTNFAKALKLASQGKPGRAQAKLETLAGVFENYFARNAAQRFFASAPHGGTWNFPNFGTVLELASLLSLVTSFSSYLTVERALAQPNAVEYFLDIRSVEGQAPPARFPVVGRTQYSNDALSNHFAQLSIIGTTISYNSAPSASQPGHVAVPHSIEITFVASVTVGGNTTKTVYKIYDDGAGNLIFPSDFITQFAPTAISLSYGNLTNPTTPSPFTFSFQITPPSGSGTWTFSGSVRYAASYVDDRTYPGQLQLNDTRYTFDLTRRVMISTKPSQLTVEFNLVDLAQAQKSLNVDLAAVLTERISDIYTKTINRYITTVYIRELYDNNPYVIDVSAPLGSTSSPVTSWNQYLPILDRIAAGLEGVFVSLYNKSFIGAQPTALLVSPRLLSFLRQMKIIDPALWTDETSGYINNLQGYFRGIPVLVHTDLEAIFDMQYQTSGGNPAWMPTILSSGGSPYAYYTCGGFAVHVRDDASLAPAFHGVYLPPTEAPTVSNFNNITQQAKGIFFMQEVVALAPELVQPFAFVGLPVPY